MRKGTIRSKLPHAGTTIFTEMSVLAQQYNAINLGQGFPDFPMSEGLIAAVDEAMRAGFNQYVHMNGYVPLREAIAEKVHDLYQSSIDPHEQITITPGGTYAIYTALTTLLQPGDEVIVFEPAYDCYIPTIELNGATAVRISLKFPDYQIDWQEVREKINEKTKLIMINTPHNPTGSVLNASDISALKQIMDQHDIFLLSDEVYEHLIFDGKQHQSILRYPELLDRSFVCFSFGKVYHCTGWKLGYCIAGKELMVEFRKIHQFNCFSCDSPKQVALSKYLQNRQDYLDLGAAMQKKRDHLKERMKKTRFKPLPSYGSYFQVYSYADISAEKEKDFAIRLTKEFGVTTVPLSAFYKDGQEHQVLRFCFAKKDETLDAAAERLINL